MSRVGDDLIQSMKEAIEMSDEDPDKYCQTTFDDWYSKKFPEGPTQELTVEYVEELMKKAWDARYFTLTYYDM